MCPKALNIIYILTILRFIPPTWVCALKSNWSPNCLFNISTWKSRRRPSLNMSTTELMVFFFTSLPLPLVLPIFIDHSILPIVWTNHFGAILKTFNPPPIHTGNLTPLDYCDNLLNSFLASSPCPLCQPGARQDSNGALRGYDCRGSQRAFLLVMGGSRVPIRDSEASL